MTSSTISRPRPLSASAPRAAVLVESVSKRFRVRCLGRMALKEALVGGMLGRRPPVVTHWALRDVSFSLRTGRSLGIIGHNGAGKSTLLRLLCGLGRPTRGRISCADRVSGLLELGSGFHQDLTGRENLITGGILSGLTEREVRARQDEVIGFAELEESIDLPVRTYSTGMYLRLAFATAMQLDPAVLVMDEVFAVRDARFQRKCLERVEAFRAAGKTLVLTSQAPEHVRALCDEVIVLEEGRVVMQGDPDAALACYRELLADRGARRPATPEHAASRPDRPEVRWAT